MACILNMGGTYLVSPLRALGHQVFCVGLERGCDFRTEHPLTAAALLLRLEAAGVRPDVSLYVDNGNLPFVLGVETLPWPSLFYSIDTFCNPWHIPFAAGFDFTLVAQKDYVFLFQSEGCPCRWMPLFFSGQPPAMPEDVQSHLCRDVPVAFVGTLRPRNIPDRLPFLERFRRNCPLVFMQGNFVPLFSRARIVLNQTAASELNFRCFEAMSLGAALLMEQCENGLEDLFTPGRDILPPYPRGDARAAASIAAEWLARPEALAAVAVAGQQLVLQRHSGFERAREVAGLMEELMSGDAASVRLADAARRRRIVSTTYAIIGAELVQPEQAALRDFFLSLHASCE